MPYNHIYDVFMCIIYVKEVIDTFFCASAFFSFFKKLIKLFLSALGLRCCMWAFSNGDEWGLPFIAVHGLLIAVASRCRAWALVARVSVVVARRRSSCSSQAQ